MFDALTEEELKKLHASHNAGCQALDVDRFGVSTEPCNCPFRLGREDVFEGLVESAQSAYAKGDRVVIFDEAGYGVRPNGERVGTGALWVRGRVEFVCNRKSGGVAGHVSVYCDDGRGRRVVGPHHVIPWSAYVAIRDAALREVEGALAHAADEAATAGWTADERSAAQRAFRSAVGITQIVRGKFDVVDMDGSL